MSTFEKVEDLASQIKEYINTRIALIKLQTAARISKALSNLTAFIIVLIIFIIALIFAGIAGATYLNQLLGNPWAGHLIVACFYVLLGLFIWWQRERLIRIPLMNSILQQLSPDHEED